MNDDVAKIAAGLSEAQRRVVLSATKMDPIFGANLRPVRAGGATIALCKKGVIGVRTWMLRRKGGYALTPLGLVVREHLEKQDA